MKKHITSTILSIFFIFIFGCSIAFLFVNAALHCPTWDLYPWHWILIAAICLLGLILSNVHRFRKKTSIEKKEDEDANVEDFSLLIGDKLGTLRQENRRSMKAILKVSILFWIHYWRKEKMKSMEETRRDVLKDLRRQFMDIEGMEEMLKEISQEIGKFQKPS